MSEQRDWRGMDGAIAFHLIDRHAKNWNDAGQMMMEWLVANGGCIRSDAQKEEKRERA